MISSQLLVSAAQLLGLSSVSALTGYIASFSQFGIPLVELAPPDLLAKQWSSMFHRGMNTAPPLALASSACFAFLAYQMRGVPGRLPVSPSMLYLSAALLAPSIAPYTWIVMWSGVQKLEAKAEESANAPGEGEIKALVQEWKMQNYQRAVIVGSSAVLSAVAMLA